MVLFFKLKTLKFIVKLPLIIWTCCTPVNNQDNNAGKSIYLLTVLMKNPDRLVLAVIP